MRKHGTLVKSGFTLLEIVVVLMIVGVLAAIALPNLFSNVERQRSQEALAHLGSIKDAIITCSVPNNNVLDTNCDSFAEIGYTESTTDWFNYTISTQANSAFTIQAFRSTVAGGATSMGTITFNRLSAGNFVCTGTGVYSGVCR